MSNWKNLLGPSKNNKKLERRRQLLLKAGVLDDKCLNNPGSLPENIYNLTRRELAELQMLDYLLLED